MEPKEEPLDSLNYMPAEHEIDNKFEPPVKVPKEEPLDDFLSIPAENEIDNGCNLPLLEPKEESLDDFLLTLAEIEKVDQSAVLKKEKEKLPDLVDLSHFDNEVQNESVGGEKEQDIKRKASCDEVSESQSVMKKPRLAKGTELKCPECKFCTAVVIEWLNHLKKKHFTTPALACRALRCECGHVSNTGMHVCSTISLTVIRTRDGPIRRLDDEKETPQCVLCETYPSTAYGYLLHLSTHHKSTLAKNGIFLRCACGIEMRSRQPHVHNGQCDHLSFTLHKLETGKKKDAVQCLLCEHCPSTALAYAKHLTCIHKSTMKKNGIYLLCSCGLEVRSTANYSDHSKECDGRKFTVHKLDKK